MPIHWLVHGHITSNNETVSRQMPRAGNIAKTMTSNGKQFTVTREMLTAVARESQRVFQHLLLFCFVITNQLMTGTLGYSEYCFPRISMFPTTSSSRETLRFSGTKFTVPLAGTCHRVLIIIWRCLTRTENYQI